MVRFEKVIEEVRRERERQEGKWGEQDHAPPEWLMILGEEVGEANKAALEIHFSHGAGAEQKFGTQKDWTLYRAELIQVAAVAVQMVECLDRKYPQRNLSSPKKPDQIVRELHCYLRSLGESEGVIPNQLLPIIKIMGGEII